MNFKGRAERKKPVSNGHIGHDFIHMIFAKRQNYSDNRQFSGCQWLKVGERCTYKVKAQDVFWVMEMFFNPNCGGGYTNLFMY